MAGQKYRATKKVRLVKFEEKKSQAGSTFVKKVVQQGWSSPSKPKTSDSGGHQTRSEDLHFDMQDLRPLKLPGRKVLVLSPSPSSYLW
jgi:hypothetical protein